MKNKSLAIRLLKKDCKSRGTLLDKKGNTCAIGCLAMAARVPRWRLFDTCSPDDYVISKIRRKFGLSDWALDRIMGLNDSVRFLSRRRGLIIKFIKKIPETE